MLISKLHCILQKCHDHCKKKMADLNSERERIPMKDLPRKERERLRRQQELLEAAEEVFSQKGFPNATIQEISEKSELATSTIYQLFQNKEEIYLALLKMRFEEFLLLLQ